MSYIEEDVKEERKDVESKRSRRDSFAIQTLAAILSHRHDARNEHIVESAIWYADTLIKYLDKDNKHE